MNNYFHRTLLYCIIVMYQALFLYKTYNRLDQELVLNNQISSCLPVHLVLTLLVRELFLGQPEGRGLHDDRLTASLHIDGVDTRLVLQPRLKAADREPGHERRRVGLELLTLRVAHLHGERLRQAAVEALAAPHHEGSHRGVRH